MRYLCALLVDQHGLDPTDALDAVTRAQLSIDGPHAELVATEARALLNEAMAAAVAERVTEAMRALVQAMQPLADAVRHAMQELSRADFALAPPAPTRARRDRPAWQSPYGPARHR